MVQEPPVRIKRRLAAILAADVAGYSRLMHRDEEDTHARLTSRLTEAVYPAIAEHGGRIVKYTGDGFLAEFSSAVQAVRAAAEFQAHMNRLTIGDAENRRLAFRVGISVGDVIVEPHDIFGDGVNIAARLESIAEPGGVCISSTAYDHVRGKLGFEFADLGEQNLKNIDCPVRAYALVNGFQSVPQATPAMSAVSSRPRLSIIVLPFANLSGDPEQDYFVDGVTESLTTDLSRIRGSFVIGRHTAFTYKGKVVDVRQIGRELNVRYVLEGSVQRSADRLRVNVQLVDAETGAHLWADRFDKPVADLFDLQDEIVSRLANTLNAQLIEAEARRAEKTPRPDSMDLYFQGRYWWNKGITSEYLVRARHFFERALSADAGNVDAMIWIATADTIVAIAFLTDDYRQYLVAAETTLLKALSLAPNHSWAHMNLGTVLIYTKRVAEGMAECERALALDRNFAVAHAVMGIAKFFMGRGADTEGHVNEALRLSPHDIFAFEWMSDVGCAKMQLSADAEAVTWFLRGIETNRNHPFSHFGLAAALALLGKSREAQAAAKTGLALNPTFTIRRVKSFLVSDNPAFLAGAKRIVKGLHMAGVPKG
ncbi:adenylate/guanylate cyclase domain-containing protein [Bradyrhizobium sp. UFLA05-153]